MGGDASRMNSMLFCELTFHFLNSLSWTISGVSIKVLGKQSSRSVNSTIVKSARDHFYKISVALLLAGDRATDEM